MSIAIVKSEVTMTRLAHMGLISWTVWTSLRLHDERTFVKSLRLHDERTFVKSLRLHDERMFVPRWEDRITALDPRWPDALQDVVYGFGAG